MSKIFKTTLMGLCLLWSVSTTAALAETTTKLKPVTIAQYGHVFLYLPLYVALDKGFFKDAGLDVKLVSTGGDEKTFTAVASGNAQFGVADPTFAAIARERGQGGKVVAGIVRGVPFWIVTYRKDIGKIDSPAGFAGYRLATYTAPSTCYAVGSDILQNDGHPVNGKIVQGAFGTLQPMLQAKQADLAIEIEPVVSIAVQNGAHIVYSPASRLGDFAFTGLTVSDDFCKKHADQVQAAVNAIGKAMSFIQTDFDGALSIAKKEFPEVSAPVLKSALKRSIQEGTIPKSPMLSKTAWDKAIALRKKLGDLKGGGSFADNVDMTFAAKAGNLKVSFSGVSKVLEASGLTFSYGTDDSNRTSTDKSTFAIRDLSLSINASEIVCILGASGCGKSTLLNLIAGLAKPSAGTITLQSNNDGGTIGYIFQDDALLPWRTVEANIMLASEVVTDRLSRQSARDRIGQYLTSFNLNNEILQKYPAQLSGGMRQRVSIIQSLMFDPQLLLLDEPFSALDFYTKLRLESEFYQLIKTKGKAALLVTHDIEEAIAMSDRVLIMSKEGCLSREFPIELAGDNRLPENARGTNEFARYYREIWNELKAVIAE